MSETSLERITPTDLRVGDVLDEDGARVEVVRVIGVWDVGTRAWEQRPVDGGPSERVWAGDRDPLQREVRGVMP